MALEHAIERAFEKKLKKGWDEWHQMYWLVDLHDVIIPGTYTQNNEGKELYPNAGDVLRWLTSRKDMCPILWTSSHDYAIDEITKWLLEHQIEFTYVNENPEVIGNDLLNVDRKLYFDVLLEDKAGFNGMTDWKVIKDVLDEMGIWDSSDIH